MERKRTYVGLGVTGLGLSIAAGLWWMPRTAPEHEGTAAIRLPSLPEPSPPELSLDLTQIDPEIADLVRQAVHEVEADERDVGRWLHLGMTYDANDLLESARSCYAYAVHLDPTCQEGWYHLAVVRALRGDLDEAIDAMRRMISLESQYAPAHWRLGQWLLDQGRLQEAKAAFETATRIDPDDWAGWIGLGRVHLNKGEVEQAAVALERVANSDSINAAYAKQLLARAYRRLGHSEQAEAAAARDLGPGLVWHDSWRSRVQSLRVGWTWRIKEAYGALAQGRYDEAAALLEQLRRARPEELAVLTNLGIAYREQHRTDDSIRTLQEALLVKPEHYPAHFELAVSYLQKSQQPNVPSLTELRDFAMEHVQRALALNPTLAAAHDLLGGLLWLREDFAGAADSFQRAWSLDPESPMYLFRAGMAYARLEQWDKVAEALQTTTRRLPSSAEAFRVLGLAHMNLDNMEQAEAALLRARELRPSDALIEGALRRVRRKRGGP